MVEILNLDVTKALVVQNLGEGPLLHLNVPSTAATRHHPIMNAHLQSGTGIRNRKIPMMTGTRGDKNSPHVHADMTRTSMEVTMTESMVEGGQGMLLAHGRTSRNGTRAQRGRCLFPQMTGIIAISTEEQNRRKENHNLVIIGPMDAQKGRTCGVEMMTRGTTRGILAVGLAEMVTMRGQQRTSRSTESCLLTSLIPGIETRHHRIVGHLEKPPLFDVPRDGIHPDRHLQGDQFHQDLLQLAGRKIETARGRDIVAAPADRGVVIGRMAQMTPIDDDLLHQLRMARELIRVPLSTHRGSRLSTGGQGHRRAGESTSAGVGVPGEILVDVLLDRRLRG